MRYLPGGLRTVARRPLPGVGHLSIVAKRYRFQRHVYLELDYRVERSDGAAGESGVRVEGTAPLSWTFGGYCAGAGADASVVVVGLLRDPRDSVLVYAHGRSRRLQTAPIPAYLQAGGVAAFTVLDQPPERIVVRTREGRTVMSEDLGRVGQTSCSGPSSLSYFVKKS
ncbi:MAG TPA: hypothetical protein VMD79_08035 [Solirubrobacteraceae bacterium]|nr:hypothetical protein [Solirubrobacteraceae bacterium]